MLDHLAPARPLILLLPTVSQVEQLAATRPDRDLTLVHGQRPLADLQPPIIATYDQLGAIVARLAGGCDDYLLVMDEVHKLYQAGGYRPKALQGILDALATLGQSGGFGGFLGLSATLQPALLEIPIDQWIRVRKPAPWVRQVAIVEYVDLRAWTQTLIRQNLLDPEALNVIRLNDSQVLHELEAFFSAHGYRCLVVHSKIQDEEDIQQMLATELVTDCQLLLTTSLLDEGINLHNPQLGCVHLIGPVHSAELCQFLGRFRQCNPEVFLHLERLPEAAAPWVIADERARMQTMQTLVHGTWLAAMALTDTSPSLTAPMVLSRVKRLNATYRCFSGFDLLLARVLPDGTVEVLPNHPGWLAYLYGLDTDNHYGSLETLRARLVAQLEPCEILHYQVGEPPPDPALGAAFQTATALAEQQRESLVEALEQRLIRLVETGEAATPFEALASLLALDGRARTHEGSLIQVAWELANEVVIDLESAFAMLRANHQRPGWRFVKGLDDALVRALHQRLAACRAQDTPGYDGPLKIPRALGRTLVLEALQDVSRRDPLYQVSAQLVGESARGVRCEPDGRYDVTAQFVTKLFRDYTDSDIERHHYLYRGPAWGGYRYRALEPARVTRRPPTRRSSR
ncbi:hypothetical protein [Thiocystis violacea]|uniref:hypothetical protein n=1 Tax=Thiocystis violacea TaxID=13725 RepID=UPI0019060E50|nr:hypothetical protein [Thiocystis violacea]MBK1719162.1 hypothetical protein [Thiocystis violacea]